MKIALVRTTLHKGSGQVVHISELVRRLKKIGHQISVFSRQVDERIDSLDIFQVRFIFDDIPYIRHVGFGVKAGVMMKDFDLVHTQYHPAIFAGNAYHFLKGRPHVFTFHGFAPVGIWRNPVQKLKMVDHQTGTFLALRWGIDQIITVSDFLKRELLKSYRFDSERINVIYNGVDIERFNPQIDSLAIREEYGVENDPLVLFLGRLAPYKGPQFLVMAAPHILKEVPDTKFVIAGSGRYDAPKLKNLARKLEVDKAFVFAGYVPHEKIPRMYASCDVFCYPSLWEGFGLTPAEAQASGKPVVAFDNCAIPEVIDDQETGLLVPPRDHKLLAQALIELLLDEKERLEMGTKGRERAVEMFSWDAMAEKTVAVYERALESRGRPR